MVRKWFTDHPASVGETYGQHLAMACGFSLRMAVGAVACFVHALLPFLFVKTGSAIISGLHERMVTHRRRRPLMSSHTAEPSVDDGARPAPEAAR